jgi:PmbA protein
MEQRESARYALERLRAAGAQNGVCELVLAEKRELTVDAGRLNLLRTTFDTSLKLLALREARRGSSETNKTDRESIDSAAARTVALAESSEPDPANGIAEAAPAGEYRTGQERPDADAMYERTEEFLAWARSAYPSTMLEQAILDFTVTDRLLLNTNGVEQRSRTSCYDFGVMFTTKAGGRATSFNYAGFAARELDCPLREYGRVDALLAESAGQLDARQVPQKLVGDLIVTPESLEEVLGFLTSSISDYPMITGTSVYRDRIGQQVAGEALTLHSRPASTEIVTNRFFTGDGYASRDTTILDRGVLRTFLLSLYGSRKTGKPRGPSEGGCFVVEAGGTPYQELLRGVERGILLSRFSGGRPAANGDFSGVAKNSYYVEDGAIAFPLSETMISGNLQDMLLDVRAISRERVDFGSAIMPWVRFGGITISGK